MIKTLPLSKASNRKRLDAVGAVFCWKTSKTLVAAQDAFARRIIGSICHSVLQYFQVISTGSYQMQDGKTFYNNSELNVFAHTYARMRSHMASPVSKKTVLLRLAFENGGSN